MTKQTEIPLGDDLLDGAGEISAFLGGKISRRNVYLYQKELGLFHLRGKLMGLKSKLSERIRKGDLVAS
jgi:hypothetical protein